MCDDQNALLHVNTADNWRGSKRTGYNPLPHPKTKRELQDWGCSVGLQGTTNRVGSTQWGYKVPLTGLGVLSGVTRNH
jgi:hypothetical protein